MTHKRHERTISVANVRLYPAEADRLRELMHGMVQANGRQETIGSACRSFLRDHLLPALEADEAEAEQDGERD